MAAMAELRWRRELAYTTVMTVIDTLFRKGWLTRELDGRAYRYVPALTREQCVAQIMHEALVDSADRGAALMHFVGRTILFVNLIDYYDWLEPELKRLL